MLLSWPAGESSDAPAAGDPNFLNFEPIELIHGLNLSWLMLTTPSCAAVNVAEFNIELCKAQVEQG